MAILFFLGSPAGAPDLPSVIAEDPSLRSALEEASSLRALETRPPATRAGLERRAAGDVETPIAVRTPRATSG